MRLRRPIHVLCALLAATLCGCGAGDSTKSETAAQSPRGGKVDRREAAPQKPVPTATCRIYTSRPGFAVFVDGRPAFDAKGEILRTPCAVTVPQGQREFTVAREGFRDAHQVVDVAGESRVVFSSIEKSAGGHASLLNAAYLRTETARPIPLLSLNSDRQDLDPYVTPDGRSLYFVSDRNGKKGIYHVARHSAYDYFEKTPRLIKSGSRLPASPMISADSLSIVYALPRLGVVYQISRESAVGEFGRGDLLVKHSGSSARCTSAQVIRDGERSWRLYWLQEARGRTQAYSAKAVEKRTAGELTGDSPDRRTGRRRVLKPLAQQTFGRPKKLDLRGDPPCMSEDGLRQYAFDGKLLTRATRKSVDEPFASPEIIANISLSNYRPTAGRRSYFLTDDEQWLFYESRGDLHMLRVFARPRRGFVLTGKPIPPLPVKVAKLPKKKKPVKPVTAPPKVDPRTRPLPYPVFRKQLLALLRDRKYEAAKKHVRAGLAEPKLADDRNLIAWDREDVRRTSAFWDDFRKAVKAMKPGDMFSIGSARVKFVKFSDGAFVAQSLTKRVVKPAAEMRPSDLIAIVDKKLGRTDPALQMRVGHFRYFDGGGNRKAALARLSKAGRDGPEFLERLAARDAQQAAHEFKRDNVARGISLAKAVLKRFPESEAAGTARKLVEAAYARMQWDAVGRRTWKRKDGAYTAAPRRVAGSLLRSQRQYQNFELRLEWRSDAPNGQGGVFFRYPGAGNPIDTAYKIQLSDDFGVPADNFCTGALFKIQAPTANAVKARGEWNMLLLRVEGERVHVVINGRTVLRTKAKSETIPRKGYVALDGGLGGITYRRTLLFALPKSP